MWEKRGVGRQLRLGSAVLDVAAACPVPDWVMPVSKTAALVASTTVSASGAVPKRRTGAQPNAAPSAASEGQIPPTAAGPADSLEGRNPA